MIACCLLCTFILLIIEYHINRDFASPIFLVGFIWLLTYFVLLCFAPTSFNVDNLYFASFFASFGAFFLGANIFCREKKDFAIYDFSQYQWNASTKYAVFFLEYVFALIIFFKSLQLMSTSSFSIWMTLHGAVVDGEGLFSTGYFGVMLSVVPVIFFISLGVYLINPNFSTRKDMLISLPPVILSMLFTTRGNWFFLIITIIYMIVYIKKISNKKIAIYGLFSFFVIAWIWIVSSLDKYELAYGNMSDADKIRLLFNGYFVNPMLNFVQWFDNVVYTDGLHTFRFICAILKSFGFNFEVVPNIQPYLYINGSLSNVYTALNWYAQDFGVWWAFVVYFILGLVYGYLYRKVKKDNACNLRFVISLSMLMMPIVNQFFDEKIFSILSIWCQRFIALFILTSPIFLVRKR